MVLDSPLIGRKDVAMHSLSNDDIVSGPKAIALFESSIMIRYRMWWRTWTPRIECTSDRKEPTGVRGSLWDLAKNRGELYRSVVKGYIASHQIILVVLGHPFRLWQCR